MADAPFRNIGYVVILGAVAVTFFPWFWVTNLSEPAGIPSQVLFLMIGLLLAGWMYGIGVSLVVDETKYALYGTIFTGLGLSGFIIYTG